MAIASSVMMGVAVFTLIRFLQRASVSAFKGFVPDSLLSQAEHELPAGTIATAQRFWVASLAGVILSGWLLSILPVALVVATIGLLLPRWYLEWMIHRRRMLLRDQLVGCTQGLANAARAGQSLSR